METLEQFFRRPSFGNWLRYYSAVVWERIGFAYNGKRFTVTETTITENLVFDFWQQAKHSLFPIEIYHSKNERTNGTDLEIFFETPQGFVYMACQAKLLKGNKYPRIGHSVNGYQQIDMLLAYAAQKKAIPTYLFYNRSYEPGTIEAIEGLSGESIEHYGCSIASAITIKNYFFWQEGKIRRIPSFGDVHPDLAMPLHYFAYPFDLWYPAINNFIATYEVKFYTQGEIEDDPDWENMTPPAKIGYITKSEKDSVLGIFAKQNLPRFNPKFRIIISIESKGVGLRRVW